VAHVTQTTYGLFFEVQGTKRKPGDQGLAEFYSDAPFMIPEVGDTITISPLDYTEYEGDAPNHNTPYDLFLVMSRRFSVYRHRYPNGEVPPNERLHNYVTLTVKLVGRE